MEWLRRTDKSWSPMYGHLQFIQGTCLDGFEATCTYNFRRELKKWQNMY